MPVSNRDRKITKHDEKIMADDVYVSNATAWADQMVRGLSRGRGDDENAMRTLEGKYGIPFNVFWRLRQGRVKDISVRIYVRLQSAYLAECERQMRKIQHGAERARQAGLSNLPAVAEIEALVPDDDLASEEGR